jgi:hypothetical protein
VAAGPEAVSRDHGGGGPVDAGPGTVHDMGAVADSVAAPLSTSVPRDRGYRVLVDRADEDALPTYFLILIGALTVGGLLLRLPSFNDSLTGDEISTFYIVNGHSLGRVLQIVYSNQETTPPLFFMLAWATKGLLANHAESIRLVSLVCGTAAIPLTFLLGLWTVGRRAALVGATCVALSPYMIFFSTNARPYMLVLFLALLSTLALVRALDTRRPGWWVAYGACSAGAAYSHYTVVFLLVAQFAWACWTQPSARRALVIANVAAGLTYVPWLGGLRADLRAPNFIGFLVKLNFQTVKQIAENFWIGHPVLLTTVLPGRLAVALAAAGLALGVVGVVFRVLSHGDHRWRPPPKTGLLIVLAVAPAVLVIAYSWTRADILGGGNVIASWPAMALTIGALVSYPRAPLRLAATALTVAAYGIGGFKMLGTAAQQPNTDAAVAYINRAGTEGDPIVSEPYFDNPLTDLDAGLSVAGRPDYSPGNQKDLPVPPRGSSAPPVIRLGIPSMAEQLRPLNEPHPQAIFFGTSIAPPSTVAHQTVALAHHGVFFLVSPATSIATLLRHYPANPLSLFVSALPSTYHIVAHVTYPGNEGGATETVFEFRSTASQ